MTSAILAAMLPHLASAAITILVPFIVATIIKYFQKLGIDIEAKHREALQSALENAAAVFVAKNKGTALSGPKDVAVDYVKNSVPDAIKKFDLDTKKIRDLLEPHIAKGVNRIEK